MTSGINHIIDRSIIVYHHIIVYVRVGGCIPIDDVFSPFTQQFCEKELQEADSDMS